MFCSTVALLACCAGALQFLPDGVAPGAIGDVAGKPVSDDDIAEMIRNLSLSPLGIGADEDFRISIAGAQEKTALLCRDSQWFKPSGTTATTPILKPQIGQLPNGVNLSNSVENESLCLKLMQGLGVPAAQAVIGNFGGQKTLIVERFDRRWTRDGRLLRLPQEDCCQALSVPQSRKYQSDGGPGMWDIIALLKGSDNPDADVATFLRANIIFWLLGATDGHAKNFSVFITPGGRFRMTPVYDVLTAQPSLDAGQVALKTFRLAMSAGKNRHYNVRDIQPRHFLQTADLARVGLSAIRTIIEELGEAAPRQAMAVIDALPPGFPTELIDAVLRAVRERSRLLAAFKADADPN